MRAKKAQNVHSLRGVAKRIRFLRGDLSQSNFAEIIGVSRSALANYETGRTKPSQEVIRAIANACDVSAEFILDGNVTNIEEFASSIGMSSNASDELTADEWAVVRMLGVCDDATIRTALTAIVTGFSQNEELRELTPSEYVLDLARLIQIAENGTGYRRGVRRANLEPMIDALRKRIGKLSQ